MEGNFRLKIPKKASIEQAKAYFRKIGLNEITLKYKKEKLNTNIKINIKNPFPPDLIDLYRLYQFIILNRRTTVLEFGCGWSSVIIMTALNNLHKRFNNQIKNLRRKHLFELFILDTNKNFTKLAKKKN